MLAVDMVQQKRDQRGLNEVEMNDASPSERHLYASLEWSCGAYVLPPNPSFLMHSQIQRSSLGSSTAIMHQEDEGRKKRFG